MRHFLALAFVAVFADFQAASAASSLSGVSSLPQSPAISAVQRPKQAVTQKTLGDCKAELRAKGGGWCEMRVRGRRPGISSVHYPLKKRSTMGRRLRGLTGQRSTLIAWCGAAFDRNNLTFYFNCGGHADYGGNEWYSFDLEAGRWERLTDPSPLNYVYIRHLKKNGEPAYHWQPDIRVVPSASHNYDGLLYRQGTGTIYYLTMPQYDGARVRSLTATQRKPVKDGGLVLGGRIIAQYEFNPSRTETRNGLRPLSWRRVGTQRRFVFARSLEKSDGEIIMGGNHVLYRVTFGADGAIRTAERVAGYADIGDGAITYDSERDLVWVTSARWMLSYDANWRRKHHVKAMPHRYGKGLAIGDDGLLRAWDGVDKVYVFDPDKPQSGWRVENWEVGGPQTGDRGRTYEKFQYIGDGFYAGVSSPDTGVWVYMPSKGRHSEEISPIDPQSFIDRARAGDTVTIPPGIYGRGLRISKSLTVRLPGVSLRGVRDGKGIINIEGENLHVVIEDFAGDGKAAGATSGNLAGIRIVGRNFRVLVRRAHIRGTVMGILTDNRGGRLVVEDSLIEELGRYPKRTDLTHGLYAGGIDELIVRNTTVRAPRGLGHLVKSRARQTTLDHVRLIGLNARHSRMVDLPCGGRLTIMDSVLQQGTNTDNAEMIGVGLEKANCGRHYAPADVTMLRSTLVFDRDFSGDEPARSAGSNYVFGWRNGIKGINVKNNRIVDKTGRVRWNAYNPMLSSIMLPMNLTSLNQIFRSRLAAGLRPKDNAEP